jgi:hypothetical protein
MAVVKESMAWSTKGKWSFRSGGRITAGRWTEDGLKIFSLAAHPPTPRMAIMDERTTRWDEEKRRTKGRREYGGSDGLV